MSNSVEINGAPLTGVACIVAACAKKEPLVLFGAVDEYARSVLGQTLCTVNRFDAEREEVVRLYSSNPAAYPPGGRKAKAGSAWGRQVLHERQVFVGEGTEAICQAFDDHDAILALGLRSVINVPVVARDVCLGTLNFLMPIEIIKSSHVQFALLAGLLTVPAFLALRYSND